VLASPVLIGNDSLPWVLDWGATIEERRSALLGDDIVNDGLAPVMVCHMHAVKDQRARQRRCGRGASSRRSNSRRLRSWTLVVLLAVA
jgi:hypothetical protein